MTDEDFQKACEHRLHELYRKDNAALGKGIVQPIERFHKAPEELQRELNRAIHRFKRQYGSLQK